MNSSDAIGGGAQGALERLGLKSGGEIGSLVGQVVDGRWRLTARIGHGAFGQVYEARDASGGRVALKIFNDAFLNSGYLQELGLMFDEEHENVVKVLSFGYTSGRKYLTYEYVPGGTLRDFLINERRVRPVEAVSILADVARGLAFAHERNVVHRDLKPENILLTSQAWPFTVKLCDFGLSARFSRGERLNSSFGSPAYMAPEQFDGDYDWRVDYYALGVILYEMLFGRRPFTGDATSICYAQKNHEIALPQISTGGLNELLRKLLDRDPAKRFQSADALVRALNECRSKLALEGALGRIKPPARQQLTLKQRWLASLPHQPSSFGVSPGGELVFYASKRVIAADSRGQFMELLRPERRPDAFALGRGALMWTCGERVHTLEGSSLGSWTLDDELERAPLELVTSPDGAHVLALSPSHVYLYTRAGRLVWRADVETYGALPPACFSQDGSVVWMATEAPRTQLIAVNVAGAKLCRATSPGPDVELCSGPGQGVFVGLKGKGALYMISAQGFIEREARLIEALSTLHRMGDGRVAAMSKGHVEFFDVESLESQAFVDLPSVGARTFFGDDGLYQVGPLEGEVRIHYHALSR